MRGGWRACADRCARRASPCLPAMALSPHRAFDPLLRRAARLTSIITTIEAEVAGAFSMPILSVLDDPMPLEITGGLLPGRCEAARSFKAAAEAAVAAQQRRGSHRAAQAHRPRVSRAGGLRSMRESIA